VALPAVVVASSSAGRWLCHGIIKRNYAALGCARSECALISSTAEEVQKKKTAPVSAMVPRSKA
jgi:hypothetical protein